MRPRRRRRIAAEADAQHAEGGGGERAAEEAHGGAGEVGDVAEGEVVDLGASGDGEEGDDVGAGCGVGGGEGEVSADDGDESGEGDECVEMPVEGAAVGGAVCDAGECIGAGEEAADHQGEGGEGGEAVVLLPVERVKKPRTRRPRGGGRETASCSRAAGKGAVTEGADLVGDGGGQEDGPGHDPDGEVEPEEPDGGVAVVVGDAVGEEAGDVLVVEIEPGPASGGGEAEAGGQGDWRDCGGRRGCARARRWRGRRLCLRGGGV